MTTSLKAIAFQIAGDGPNCRSCDEMLVKTERLKSSGFNRQEIQDLSQAAF